MVVVFPSPKRCGSDRGHDNIFAVRHVFQPIPDREVHLGFGLTVKLQFIRQNPRFGSDLLDSKGNGCLRDFKVAGHIGQQVL